MLQATNARLVTDQNALSVLLQIQNAQDAQTKVSSQTLLEPVYQLLLVAKVLVKLVTSLTV